MTVRAVDPDGEHGFTVYFQCFAPGEKVEIDMYDEGPVLVAEATISCGEPPADITPGPGDTASDHFTVASYGDWEYHDVTDGFILDVANGNNHMVNDHYNHMGLLTRDEPVIHADYTLGVSDMETLEDMPDGSPRRVKDDPDNELTRQEKNAYVEEGQRTIQVLAGQPTCSLPSLPWSQARPTSGSWTSTCSPSAPTWTKSPCGGAPTWLAWTARGRLALNNEVELSAAKALAL